MRIAKYVSAGLKRLRKLPPHAYDEQFSENMDLASREWADRFLMIASTPRCGSHYLGHMLMGAGEYGVPLEYLHLGNARYWKRRFGKSTIPELFPKFVGHRTSENGVFTFKAHWLQFEPFKDQIPTLTRGRGIEKIVWISRRDQLSQAISYVIARQTGAWISGAVEQSAAHYKYNQIVKAAEETRRSNIAWRSYLEVHYPGRFLTTVYEDIARGDSSSLEEISSFLGGAKSLQSPERTKRQHSPRNAEWRAAFLADLKGEHNWIVQPPTWLS